MKLEADVDETFELRQTMAQGLKEHICNKWKQFQEIWRLIDNLVLDELFIDLDYSKKYKSKYQTKIQSAYFGSTSFSLFITWTYHNKDEIIETLPITVRSEESNKLQVVSLLCIIYHSIIPYLILYIILIIP